MNIDSQTILIILGAVLIAGVITGALFFLRIPFLDGLLRSSNVRGHMRNIVEAQRRNMEITRPGQRKATVLESASENQVQKVASSKLTLRKRLKYAQWKLPPVMFRLLEVVVSIFAFGIVSIKLGLALQLMSLLAGPVFMGWLLNFCMDRRFKAFDQDYPAFLLSLVGLLKTGMNAMGAIEAASQSLEEGSLLKDEVEMMVERLRFGVSEEKSIGSFGEDIYHPEIELFVQALLLSRRVGGNLSDTLERLAKQVRKRQFFRMSAHAAVGMQRGSIWIIILILVLLEVYLAFTYPAAVTGAWKDEMGQQVWQGGIIVILGGIFWVRQVTKIRI